MRTRKATLDWLLGTGHKQSEHPRCRPSDNRLPRHRKLSSIRRHQWSDRLPRRRLQCFEVSMTLSALESVV